MSIMILRNEILNVLWTLDTIPVVWGFSGYFFAASAHQPNDSRTFDTNA